MKKIHKKKLSPAAIIKKFTTRCILNENLTCDIAFYRNSGVFEAVLTIPGKIGIYGTGTTPDKALLDAISLEEEI